jgi:hypothetical protein
VSRGKGNTAPGWVAVYLRPWFPDAEKTPNSRSGRDIENTPGIAIEVKTSSEWRPYAWAAQAAKYPGDGELAVLVYIPPGMGEAGVLHGDAMALVPLSVLMPLAEAAGYAPPRTARAEAI